MGPVGDFLELRVDGFGIFLIFIWEWFGKNESTSIVIRLTKKEV